MSTKATQDTVHTVFESTQGLLNNASGTCARAITAIDAGNMDYGNLSKGLMNQLRGIYNSLADPSTWGAGFIANLNTKALAELNEADYNVEVAASRDAIATVLTTASALFPRNGSNKVIYEEITPGGSTYDTPGDLTGLRADLVDAVDKLG